MRKLALLAAVSITALAGTALPSTAAGTTSVHLDVDVAGAAPLAACDVSVADGANGLAVLDAAVASGCIDGYETRTFPGYGEMVTCINDICQTPDETLNALFWAISVDGHSADEGVSGLRFPAAGSTLGFSYTTWLTGFVPGATA